MHSKDMAEMDDSVVGAQHAVPAVGRRFTPAAYSDNETAAAINGHPTAIPLSNNQQPETSNAASFDAAALHAQLADLLQIYLKRAADPDAVKQCSAKDALACAKALTGMMSDVQSGKLSGNARRVVASKPASVNSWVQPPIQADDHRSRRLDSRRHPSGKSFSRYPLPATRPSSKTLFPLFSHPTRKLKSLSRTSASSPASRSCAPRPRSAWTRRNPAHPTT